MEGRENIPLIFVENYSITKKFSTLSNIEKKKTLIIETDQNKKIFKNCKYPEFEKMYESENFQKSLKWTNDQKLKYTRIEEINFKDCKKTPKTFFHLEKSVHKNITLK